MKTKQSSAGDHYIPRTLKPQKSLLQYLKDNVKATPNKVALSFYGYDMTYQKLDQAIDQFAGGLINLGVEKGHRVALFMQNCPQFVISYFGALQAGAIVVSLNPMFKYAELEYEINDSGAETLVALDYLYPEVKRAGDRIKLKNIILTSLGDYLPEKPSLPLPPEMEQAKIEFPEAMDFLAFLRKSPAEPASKITSLKEDIALLQYTGGTSGLPKGAIITHYTLAHNAAAVPLWFDYTKDDIIGKHINDLFGYLHLEDVYKKVFVEGVCYKQSEKEARSIQFNLIPRLNSDNVVTEVLTILKPRR